MIFYESNFKNILNTADKYFKKFGASNTLERFSSSELVEIEAIGVSTSGSEIGVKKLNSFDIKVWRYLGEKSFEPKPLRGSFLYSTSKVSIEWEDQKVLSQFNLLKLTGFISNDEESILIKSLEVLDEQDYPNLLKKKNEVLAPESYKTKLFGELNYFAKYSYHRGGFRDKANEMIDIIIRDSSSTLEKDIEKLELFYEKYADQTLEFIKENEKVNKKVMDLTSIVLKSLSLNDNMISCVYSDRPEVHFIHVVTFYKEGKFIKTQLDTIEKALKQ